MLARRMNPDGNLPEAGAVTEAMNGIRAVAVVIIVLMASSCAGRAESTAGGQSSAGSSDAFLRTPLRLPTLAAGATCPVSPVADVRVGVASPRGGPTFYLGGPNPKAGSPWNKTVYALVAARGPVLLRGARLDGSGSLKFDGVPADPGSPAETFTAPSGQVSSFYTAVTSPAAMQGDGTNADVFYLYPSVAGCYAIQADGHGFENVVIFQTVP